MHRTVTDQHLMDIFTEYIFVIILMLCEKVDEDFRINDVRTFSNLVDKYVQVLQPHFINFFNKWRKNKCHNLRNKMIEATLEDIYKKKNDNDFKDVFRMLKAIIKKNIHFHILKDFGCKIERKASFKVDIKENNLKVHSE